MRCTDLPAPALDAEDGRACASLPLHGAWCEPVRVVDPAATAGGDGLSWETAYALAEALADGTQVLWPGEGISPPRAQAGAHAGPYARGPCRRRRVRER
ncbi:MAG: hypothetical protein R2939_06040 [Kofleriaceae bacterium]